MSRIVSRLRRKLEQRLVKGFSFRLTGLLVVQRIAGGEQLAQIDEVNAKENELLFVQCGGIIVMCWTSVNKNFQRSSIPSTSVVNIPPTQA